MPRLRPFALLSLFGASVAFVACGGGMAPMEAPSKGYPPPTFVVEREPQTIEEATAQLERAKQAFGGTHEAGAPPTASGTAVHPTAPHPDVEPLNAADECTNLCRAFSSMQRAQAAICRLAGDSDPRCVEAKKVVEDNAKRVAQCSCR